MERVALGSVCQVCNSNAGLRFDEGGKRIHLNNQELKEFVSNCVSHISEDLPML